MNSLPKRNSFQESHSQCPLEPEREQLDWLQLRSETEAGQATCPMSHHQVDAGCQDDPDSAHDDDGFIDIGGLSLYESSFVCRKPNPEAGGRQIDTHPELIEVAGISESVYVCEPAPRVQPLVGSPCTEEAQLQHDDTQSTTTTFKQNQQFGNRIKMKGIFFNNNGVEDEMQSIANYAKPEQSRRRNVLEQPISGLRIVEARSKAKVTRCNSNAGKLNQHTH